MKRYNCFGLIILILIATACKASSSSPDEGLLSSSGDSKTELSTEDLRRFIARFEKPGATDSGKGAQVSGDEAWTVHRFLSPGYGWMVEIWSGDAKYLVSQEIMDVVDVRYSDREPRKVGSNTDGWIDSDKLREKAVKITADDARRAAREFVNAHWRRPLLQGLGEIDPKLVFSSGRYRFVVSWSLVATGERVIFGLRRVRVNVNPITGEVFCVSLNEMEAPKSVRISADQFQQIIEAEFEHLEELEIEYVQLSVNRTRDGGQRPTWVASLRFLCSENIVNLNPYACHGFGTLIIDANTGEILDKSLL